MRSRHNQARQALTAKFVENADSGGKTVSEFFDVECTGLSIRVSAQGRKTWNFLYTSPRDRRRARITLGTYPATCLEEARDLAIAKRHLVERGIDPRDISSLKDMADAAPLIAAFAKLVGPQQKRAALDFMKAMIDGLSARPRKAISSK